MVVLEECTEEYITANVQIMPLSGKLELIFSQVFINDPQKVELLRTGSIYYSGCSLCKS